MMEPDTSEDLKTESSPKRSMFFHPSQPSQNQVVEQLRQYMGWNLASSPETADCCMLFDTATWVTLPDGDPWAEAASTWINGRCRDISKRTVERVFETVFGYPLAIDPLIHQGVCLRKSNLNCVIVNGVKDVVVLACPIPLDEFSDHYVYERLVDSRVPGLGIIDLPTTVVGGEVVSVFRVIRPDWISTGCFDDKALDVAAVYPKSVFSRQELEQIAVFCDAMGFDFGKLDIIRDNVDQRIYILDANKTPGSGTHPRANLFKLEQLARAFSELYPSRSAIPPSSISAVTPHGTNDLQDGATSIAAQVDAHTQCISRLESEVGKLAAGIARLLAADCVPPECSGKKKRKK